MAASVEWIINSFASLRCCDETTSLPGVLFSAAAAGAASNESLKCDRSRLSQSLFFSARRPFSWDLNPASSAWVWCWWAVPRHDDYGDDGLEQT